MPDGKGYELLMSRNPYPGAQDGIFVCAYKLQYSDDLLEHERSEPQDLLSWMDANLDVPSRFNRTRSKGYYRRNTKSISWLKSSTTHISPKCSGSHRSWENKGFTYDIGWPNWDPIGLPSAGQRWDNEECQDIADEYDSYLVHAVSQLRRGASETEVVDSLVQVEAGHMGFGEKPNSRARAQAMVAAIHSDKQLWTYTDD